MGQKQTGGKPEASHVTFHAPTLAMRPLLPEVVIYNVSLGDVWARFTIATPPVRQPSLDGRIRLQGCGFMQGRMDLTDSMLDSISRTTDLLAGCWQRGHQRHVRGVHFSSLEN